MGEGLGGYGVLLVENTNNGYGGWAVDGLPGIGSLCLAGQIDF